MRILAIALVLAGAEARAACPAYTTCAFQPAIGVNPSDADLDLLLEDAASNKLGARGPTIPQIKTGLDKVKVPPEYACVMLKPIAATESSMQQFCPGTGKTLVSFDCGFGIMQVTSGAASYGEKLSSDTAWNVGAGSQILVQKWNASYGGTIGDNDPFVVEDWYYAVWAYNGFVYSNNPDNPEHPPNRPPFNGPSSLSRRSYGYPDIVWGYLRYPLDWKSTPRWDAIEVTYPPPGLIGSDPGDLPKILPEHRSECGMPIDPGPCTDCPFDGIVDDADPGFSLVGPGEAVMGLGYKNGLRRAPTRAGETQASGRFTLEVPKTGDYQLAVFVPAGLERPSRAMPIELHARGQILEATLDLGSGLGRFHSIGHAKLVQGAPATLLLGDATGEADRQVAFDAVWIVEKPGARLQPIGSGCQSAIDCEGASVCAGGTCAAGCETGGCAAGTCDPSSGLCLGGAEDAGFDAGLDLGIDAGHSAIDAGVSPIDAEVPMDATAGPDLPLIASASAEGAPESGCGCRATRVGGVETLLALALVLTRRAFLATRRASDASSFRV